MVRRLDDIVYFSEIEDGEFFHVISSPEIKLMKHILPPWGNECATNEHLQIILLKENTRCKINPIREKESSNASN